MRDHFSSWNFAKFSKFQKTGDENSKKEKNRK